MARQASRAQKKNRASKLTGNNAYARAYTYVIRLEIQSTVDGINALLKTRHLSALNEWDVRKVSGLERV